MTFDEAVEEFAQAEVNIKTDLKTDVETAARDAVALIINRIQQEGIEGKRYSANPLPPFFFEGKALNSGGRALLESHKKKKSRSEARERGEKVRANSKIDDLANGISYEEWRKANGLQTDHIDLTFTGKMWRGVKMTDSRLEGTKIIVTYGGFDKETQDKLQWNAQRFGNYFMLTSDEITIITNTQSKLFEDTVRRHLTKFL